MKLGSCLPIMRRQSLSMPQLREKTPTRAHGCSAAKTIDLLVWELSECSSMIAVRNSEGDGHITERKRWRPCVALDKSVSSYLSERMLYT